MNQRRLLLWGGGLFLVIVLVLLVAQSVAAQPGRSPALEESPPFAEPVMSSANYNISWDVLANGGGVLTSSHYRLGQTIGQPAIGVMTSAHYRLHAGFWQMFLRTIYMPFVRK